MEFVSSQVTVFEKDLATGFSHRRPDMIARRELNSVAVTRWISDAYNNVEDKQITTVKLIGVVATIGGGAVAVALESSWLAFAVLNIELVDAAYTIYDNVQGYQADQKALNFAQGASVLLGPRYLESVKNGTSSLGARSLDVAGATLGAALAGLDVANVSRAAAKTLAARNALLASRSATISGREFALISDAMADGTSYAKLFNVLDEPNGIQAAAKFLTTRTSDIAAIAKDTGQTLRSIKEMQSKLSTVLSVAKKLRPSLGVDNLVAPLKGAPDIQDGTNALGEEIEAVEFEKPKFEIPKIEMPKFELPTFDFPASEPLNIEPMQPLGN